MRPLAEQDHYEILEAPRGASPAEIERAYRVAQITYADDSLAGYSIFQEGDAQALRERMEEAYRVLSDHEARQAYDVALAESGETSPSVPDEGEPGAAPPASLDAFEEFDEDSGDYDGPRLRRSRLRRGLEIEQVAAITKINPLYLRFLEEERFPDLPAPVYVRGFVSAYASCLGLDVQRVAKSYMQRLESERAAPRRRRSR